MFLKRLCRRWTTWCPQLSRDCFKLRHFTPLRHTRTDSINAFDLSSQAYLLAANKNKSTHTLPFTFTRNHCSFLNPSIFYDFPAVGTLLQWRESPRTRPAPNHPVSRNFAQSPSSMQHFSAQVARSTSDHHPRNCLSKQLRQTRVCNRKISNKNMIHKTQLLTCW